MPQDPGQDPVGVRGLPGPPRAGADEPSELGPGVRERHLLVRGLPWRYLEGGDGEPLLFLHGGGAMGQTWCGAFPPLARRHRVLLPDLPGFGATPPDPGLETLPDVVTRLTEFLPAAGFAPGVVLGNSLGGYLAAALALREPAWFRALVLLAPAGFGPDRREGDPLPYPLPGAMNRVLFHHPARVAGCFPRMGPEEASRRARNARETTRTWVARGFPPLPLPRLRAPVLLLWGNEDQILPVTAAPQVRDRLRQAELKVLEDCGHVPTWEAPVRVASEVEGFLARLGPGPGTTSPPGYPSPMGPPVRREQETGT